MATLAAPKVVSPLIKFCRWTALITGITYGHFHYNHLAKKEVGIQVHENAIKAKRDERLAAEKEAATKVEMDALAAEMGAGPAQ